LLKNEKESKRQVEKITYDLELEYQRAAQDNKSADQINMRLKESIDRAKKKHLDFEEEKSGLEHDLQTIQITIQNEKQLRQHLEKERRNFEEELYDEKQKRNNTLFCVLLIL
jgi:chromosome segregation ATPase